MPSYGRGSRCGGWAFPMTRASAAGPEPGPGAGCQRLLSCTVALHCGHGYSAWDRHRPSPDTCVCATSLPWAWEWPQQGQSRQGKSARQGAAGLPTMLSSSLSPPPAQAAPRRAHTALCRTGPFRRAQLRANLIDRYNDGQPLHRPRALRSRPSRVRDSVCRAGAAGFARAADAGAAATRNPRPARAVHGRAAGSLVHAAPAMLKRDRRKRRQRAYCALR